MIAISQPVVGLVQHFHEEGIAALRLAQLKIAGMPSLLSIGGPSHRAMGAHRLKIYRQHCSELSEGDCSSDDDGPILEENVEASCNDQAEEGAAHLAIRQAAVAVQKSIPDINPFDPRVTHGNACVWDIEQFLKGRFNSDKPWVTNSEIYESLRSKYDKGYKDETTYKAMVRVRLQERGCDQRSGEGFPRNNKAKKLHLWIGSGKGKWQYLTP